jgi:hypothetical protein
MRTSGSWRKVVEALLIGANGFFVLAILFSLLTAPQIDEGVTRFVTGHNLVSIGRAFHDYHEKYGRFPPAAVYDKENHPLLSWRVLLLPFMDEKELYSQFRLDEPWDSPTNMSLLAKMPRLYAPPTGKPPQEPFATYYQVFVGPGAAFEGQTAISFASFSDGTSQTILVIEAGEPVAWTKPEDLPFVPGQPLPKLGGLSKLRTMAVFADGGVRPIPRGTDEKIIRALITRNGGEAIDFDKLGL